MNPDSHLACASTGAGHMQGGKDVILTLKFAKRGHGQRRLPSSLTTVVRRGGSDFL